MKIDTALKTTKPAPRGRGETQFQTLRLTIQCPGLWLLFSHPAT